MLSREEKRERDRVAKAKYRANPETQVKIKATNRAYQEKNKVKLRVKAKKWREENKEWVRDYKATWRLENKDRIKARRDTQKSRDYMNAYNKVYGKLPDVAFKNKARCAVTRAIKNGALVRKPCEICGELKVEAHHDDYTKRLDVRWLCVKHHTEHHVKERKKERNNMKPNEKRVNKSVEFLHDYFNSKPEEEYVTREELKETLMTILQFIKEDA